MSARGAEERSAERARILRAERTAALARRGAAQAARPATRYLVCACGPERYGLSIAVAAQVLPIQVLPMRPCTPVPGAVPALIGLAALSGRMVGVLGLARALGRGIGDPGPDGHLVALKGTAQPVALAVDRVLGVASVDDEVVEPPSAAGGMGGEAVSGYCPAGAEGAALGDFLVLDLARLLRRALP
ncbi:chemotaxis protein CheW [Methylobacterium dankookense]|uniref:CheW-like domain-containing protein n=1 Tax=Methylobacterium dankookense TaxID=560405 RepID=A0A564G2V3_9HYPH|nr:chemotaxis protein CheW [Methylobacterium dankookense]GJD54665.1 hypothetical protein IFDJLNFL_0540 [Methylobacterium dankookense]VUF14442.1 hypothetical protein MTDSW087_04167 [Methylobacterium dankookense]